MNLRGRAAPTGSRRLLVIAYDFGHNGNVGGLRWAGITKYLGRLGWKVAVVTAVPPVGSAPPIDAQVERCPRLGTLFDGYRLLRRLASRSSGASSKNGSGAAPRSGLPGTLRQLANEVVTLLTLPDESHGWMLRATVRARSVIRRFRPHVVVSSGPPHAAHLVAGMATIGSAARWWIDLRDPWAGPIETVWQSHWRLGTRVFRTIAPLLERFAFRAADGVITNTTQLADVLAAKYPDVPFVSVPNGVDLETVPPAPTARERFPGLGLAHVGKLYAGRDLRPVVLALRTFLDRHPDAAAAGSKLRIAGAADPRNVEAFTRAVAETGLEQHVDALGVLSRTEALNVVSRSRLVFVLAQEQELQIPAKLYESVAMRVPTLVVAPPDSAAGMEGKRLGALVCDSSDVAGIAGVLEQLWRDGVRDPSPCPVPITYDAIAPLIDRVLMMAVPVAPTRQAAAASV